MSRASDLRRFRRERRDTGQPGPAPFLTRLRRAFRDPQPCTGEALAVTEGIEAALARAGLCQPVRAAARLGRGGAPPGPDPKRVAVRRTPSPSRQAAGWRPGEWCSRASRESRRQRNAPSRRVEAGAAVALPLQQLEPVHLPSAAAAPGLGQGGAHRGGAWRAGTFPPGGPHAARVALERYPVPAALPDVLAGLKVMNDVSIAYECEKAIC